MESFDPIVIKVKMDAADARAELAALKRAMADFESQSKTTGDHVGDDFKREGKSADDFGRLVTTNMRDGKTAMESLRLKSTDLRSEVERLRTEFAKTGSVGAFVGLKSAEADFKRVNTYLQQMESSSEGLAPNMRQLTSAGTDSLNIFEEMSGTLGAMGPAIAIGVAALAPLIGGVAGGSVLSLLAGGGLAAGIITQFGSSQVQSAIQTFGDEVGDAWMSATEGFQSQTASAIATLGQYLAPTLTNLGQAFSHFAPVLDELANVAGGALQDLGDNLAADFGELGPIFTALERSIPVVVTGISEFFGDIADQAPAIGNDIETIAHGFETLANVTGHVIGGLAVTMAGLHAGYQVLTGDWVGFAQTLRDTMGDATPVTTFGDINQIEKQLGDTTDTLAGQYAKLAAEMKTTFDESMALDGSEVSMYEAENNLRDALKQNKGAWDITTRAGEEHRTALLQAIQATEEYYTNLGKVNGISPQLAAGYKNQIDSLLALAGKAGLSKDQVAALKSQFDSLIVVMDKANGKAVTIPVDVVYHVENRPSTGALAGRMPFAQSGVHYQSARDPEHYDRSGIYRGRPGGYYMGEASTGDEALIGRTSNPGRAMSALVAAASWHGMAVTPSPGGAFTGPLAAGGGGGAGGGVAMADVYLDKEKVGRAMISWSQQTYGRSGVTGFTPVSTR